MAVNGVEIQVGQEWKTREGQYVRINCMSIDPAYPWGTHGGVTYSKNGQRIQGLPKRPDDLIQLTAGPGFVTPEPVVATAAEIDSESSDAAPATNSALTDDNGWFSHMPGGAQPEITKGQRIQVRTIHDSLLAGVRADTVDWTRVCAYRLVYGKAPAEKPADPLSTQVAGDHYKKLAIQPAQYIHANKIGFFEGNVIKYVTRWRDKGGIADLEKAKHFIELLVQLETKGGSK